MRAYKWPIVAIVGLTLAAVTVILVSDSEPVEHLALLFAFVGTALAMFTKNGGTNGTS